MPWLPLIKANLLVDSLAAVPLVAYSTRKLRNAYSGPAIRVTRSSDNTQLDIGFNGAGQLDTSTMLNFVTASTFGKINTWYDQSGNGINSIAGNGPSITASGVVYTLNGNPATRFGISSVSNNMQSVLNITQPTTIAFAAKYNSLITNAHYTDGTTTSPREIIGVSGTPPTAWTIYAGNALTGGTPDLVSHAYIGIFNSTSSSLIIDGTTIISGNASTLGLNSLTIGAANGGGGAVSTDSWMGDFLVFNSVLGSSDQNLIRASFQTQWGTV